MISCPIWDNYIILSFSFFISPRFDHNVMTRIIYKHINIQI